MTSAGAARARPTSPRRPVPAPERPRHLEVVRGRPVPGRRPPLVVATALITLATLFALVIANVLIGQAAFAGAELQGRVAAKRLQSETLELEVARLRSPARLAARASEFGLVAAGDLIVLTGPLDRGPSPRRGRP